jgi:hypothetical protein
MVYFRRIFRVSITIRSLVTVVKLKAKYRFYTIDLLFCLTKVTYFSNVYYHIIFKNPMAVRKVGATATVLASTVSILVLLLKTTKVD